MSSRLRAACLAGLFAGCAAVMFVGCSSDDSKKKAGIPVGEAGEGGAAGAPSAGTGGVAPTPEGGAAGDSPAAAGEGGAAVVGAAGEGGAVGEGGAAGSGPLACEPTGLETGISLPPNVPLNVQKVCRGAFVSVQFDATASDDTFTCCGVSDNTVPYAVDIQGVTQGAEGDTFGSLAFLVPTDAPLGAASITATCSGADTTHTIDINVTTTPVPVVTDLKNGLLSSGDTLQVNGTGMDLITQITAVSADGSTGSYDCSINPASQSADSVSCSFNPGGGIYPGNYYVVVTAADCGSAVDQPLLTIKPPPT